MNGEKKECWIEAGFAEFSCSGVEGVRVEVLAKSLGVIKGSFCRRLRSNAQNPRDVAVSESGLSH